MDKSVDGGDGLQKNQANSADPPSSVDVMALCIHEKIKTKVIGDFASRYPTLPNDTSRCCKRAIGHIAQVGSSVIIHFISFGLFWQNDLGITIQVLFINFKLLAYYKTSTSCCHNY